jgi:hypothetical protein
VTGKVGNRAVNFNRANSIQLPPTVANFDQITIATWVYPRSTDQWQRIFDFGNGESENMFLTNRTDTRKLRFAIKNGGEEQRLDADPLILSRWSHVAVTLGNDTARIYVNGEVAAESDGFTIKPSDFNPLLNYIGRSQYPDPLFSGYVDDFRIYNYVLPADEIQNLMNVTSVMEHAAHVAGFMTVYPNPASNAINISYNNHSYLNETELHIVNLKGQVVRSTRLNETEQTLDISELESGVYFVRLFNSQENLVQKLIVK